MAKKVCPGCNKKINERLEICDHCGYFFSRNYNIDFEGRPYSRYQEENHQGHADYQNGNVGSNQYDSNYNNQINDSNTYNNSYNNGMNNNVGYNSGVNDSNNLNIGGGSSGWGNSNNASNSMNTNTTYKVNNYDNILNIEQDKLIKDLTDEELQDVYKRMSSQYNISNFIVKGFMALWLTISSFMLVAFIFSGMYFTIIIPIIFIVVGISVLCTSTRMSNQLKKMNNYIKQKDYGNCIEYVRAVGVKKRNAPLLLMGGVIAYYRLHDDKLARQLLIMGMEIDSNAIFTSMEVFSSLIRFLDFKEEVGKMEMMNRYRRNNW